MTTNHSTRLSQVHDEEDGQHTAARDYPELGSILDDRPDPGGQITVIGMRRQGDAYGTPDDARREDYNGDEGNLGMNWAEPGQQAWVHEHLGPQEEAPPPPYDPEMMPPAMARLAAIEEARGFFGRVASDDDFSWRPHRGVPHTPHPASRDELLNHLWIDHGEAWGERSTASPHVLHDNMHQEIGYYPADHQHDYPDEHGHDPVFGSARHATDINGTHVDDAGDAPQHGTVPRAEDPDSYDDASDEGGGDDKWNEPLPWGDKKNENAATTGMYPEGVSAGGGPGISVGPVTAALSDPEWGELAGHMREGHGYPPASGHYSDHMRAALAEDHAALHDIGDADHQHGPDYDYEPYWDIGDASGQHYGSRREARVPWTGAERGRLHRWQEEPTATWGDFVPSAEFTGLKPGEHVVHDEDGKNEGIGEAVAAVGDARWEAHLRNGHGWGDRQIEGTRARGDRLSDMHAGLHDAGMANHTHPDSGRRDRDEALGEQLTERFGPERFVNRTRDGRPGPGGQTQTDAFGRLVSSDPVRGRTPDEWQQKDPAYFRRLMNALNVHVRIDGKELPQHEHDDEENSLDHDRPEPSTGNADSKLPAGKSTQAGEDADSLDAPVDIPGQDPDEAGQPGSQPAGDPESWPTAGADVSETSRAYTQGSGDGKVTRGAPAPPAFSPDDADSGGGGDQDQGTDPNDSGGEEDTPFSATGSLAMFTAAAASPSFRFHFTAAWNDVVAKASRIRKAGHVRIVHASAGMVIGEVRGDHDTYESGIQRPVGKRQSIQHWACGCPWASFHQDGSAGGRYSGRPCSHVMALQFEAQSRGMFGRSFDSEPCPAQWSPDSVVVKSLPPYEGEPHRGRWREQWRAPLARRSASSDVPGQECLYEHDGACPMVQPRRTAESLSHSRPRDFRAEHAPNPDFDPHSKHPEENATHLMTGYVGNRRAGRLHYSVSDDGLAHTVHMLHSDLSHRGVASAMMDDLYGKVKQAGGWLNHQHRTHAGNNWWARYSEPYPEVNVHHQPPESGWDKYWDPTEVVGDSLHNKEMSGGRGVHTDPAPWNVYRRYQDAHHTDYERHWTHRNWGHIDAGAPAWHATAVLARHGADPDEVGALRLLAGLRAETALRVACMGNSIAANGNCPGGDSGLSFLRWASLLSDGRIRHAGSFSAGGASSSQILASQLAPVIAARPDACVIGPWAVNNPVLGVSLERTAADARNAVMALRVAGITPLLSLEPPAADPERAVFVRQYNAWARRFAFRSGVPVADFFAPLSDDGNWAPGYTADGLHPNTAAARIMGQAVAGLLPPVASMTITADQANGSWGSENVSERPTQKPYGATSPPDVDQSPASYGFLSAPDPEDWGTINDQSAMQMPITNTAAHQVLVPGAPRPMPGDLHWPGVDGWQPEGQGTFSYTDHATAAGSSTAMSPRDPQGIRMEEALGELHDEPEGALPETTGDDGVTAAWTGEGAEGQSGDEAGLLPDDQSIQTTGNQQWSGGGADSDEVTVPAGQPQGSIEDIVASFQRSAAAGGYVPGAAPQGDLDIAAAARAHLSKTAEALPKAEADALIREGRGQRARNLDLLRLEGTHYEDEDDDLERRGLNLDEYDDDVVSA